MDEYFCIRRRKKYIHVAYEEDDAVKINKQQFKKYSFPVESKE